MFFRRISPTFFPYCRADSDTHSNPHTPLFAPQHVLPMPLSSQDIRLHLLLAGPSVTKIIENVCECFLKPNIDILLFVRYHVLDNVVPLLLNLATGIFIFPKVLYFLTKIT